MDKSLTEIGEELRQLLGLDKLKLSYYEDLSQEERAQLKADYEERNGESISYKELEETYKGVIMKAEILEEVKKSMCDDYCKYSNMENDNEDWLFEKGSPCETCPLNRL